ncbi:MAG: 3-dehydrosphinganine reductase [Oceanicoccus sp.]
MKLKNKKALSIMNIKTVVITGGSSGIGLDLAKAYAQQGCNVALLARDQLKLDEAVVACQALMQTADQKIKAYSVDVADAQALSQCVATIKQILSPPDLLILSAGIVASERFIEQSDAGFEGIMQTNVMGSRLVVRAFINDMIAQKRGQICFVSSLGGIISTYGYSAYSASKFAVIGMAGALRQEVAEYGVGVSVLCPPEVDTPMVAKESEHILPQTRFIKDIGGTLNVKTVTKSALKGINKNQFIIVPGLMAKISYAQARFMPRVFGWFMQLMVRFSSK